MPFQRSYSKVWWGSDNQLPSSFALATNNINNNNANHLNSNLYHSAYFTQHQQQQLQQHFHQQFPPQQLQHFDAGSDIGNGNGSGYHSLDYNNFRAYSSNLSRIQEVDDEQNISKLSWEKHDSPGSLRSQDSGFSDNDESHSTRSLGRSSKTASPSAKSTKSLNTSSTCSSPSVTQQTIATPPTVISVKRVGRSEFYSPLVSVTRRISFSGTPSSKDQNEDNITGSRDMSGSGETAAARKHLDFAEGNQNGNSSGSSGGSRDSTLERERRRSRVSRKATKPLTPTKRRTTIRKDEESDEDINYDDSSRLVEELQKGEYIAIPDYNNETVYLGGAPQPYNNETVILGASFVGNKLQCRDDKNETLGYLSDPDNLTPLKDKNQRFTASTSTPKASPKNLFKMRPIDQLDYENPILSGHPPALKAWLTNLRFACDQEVMSTLQTKSISQEAFKNLTITTNTVAKLIRQLQQRALYMQSDFERIEKLLTTIQATGLAQALNNSEQLVQNVMEFTKVLERRSIFFNDSRSDRKKFEDYLEQIRIIARDTRYSLEKQHYISLTSLLDDVHVLKRYLLITIRLVFEKMVRIIVQSIEQSRCDLMLRANINMVATLTNIDYEGFASLTDAFVQNEAVRALLIICLDHRLTTVRALSLRALATICCAPAAIAQLGQCGGVEILRDILQVANASHGHGHGAVAETKRGEIERREAVSLLTQITAAWHGSEHRVLGLKDSIEAIVEGLTRLVTTVSCGQTLLLCAAAMNNLSRMEITAHYSIMSHEAIFKLMEAVERSHDHCTIFLYEQIMAMLYNMSLNKKCHSHLANGNIINFITSTYQTEFYRAYDSRSECDAQRRTIKMILHTLTRLVHDSSLGSELLEQQRLLPECFRTALLLDGQQQSANTLSEGHNREVTLLVRQLLMAQKQTQFLHKDRNDNSTFGILEDFGHEREAGIETEKSKPVLELELEPEAEEKIQMDEGIAIASTSGLKFNLTRQESYV